MIVIKIIPYTRQNQLKYSLQSRILKFAPSDATGVMLVNSEDDTLVGYCAWKNNWVLALEVTQLYRGLGYGEKLLGMAIKAGVTGLTVRKNNVVAINLYRKLGFKPTLEGKYRMNMELI